MNPYRSSKIFAALKGTKEQIKDNYSSGQYMDVLDDLLLKALRPMVESSSWLTTYMGNIIGWYAANNRRKISIIPKPKLLTLMTTFLVLKSADERLECVTQMRLERSFLFSALSDWNALGEQYIDAHIATVGVINPEYVTRAQTLAADMKATGERDLFCAAQDSNFWLLQATAFKAAITEKFHRKLIMDAQRAYTKSGNRLDLDDLIQDMALITSKAIDKFDQSKGTLTSHLEDWWLSVKHEAFDNLVKHSHLSLDDHLGELATCVAESSVEDAIIHRETIGRIQELAIAVDPVGLGRISLGIYES